MKIALCFIISYDHILIKENLWREWIEYNKDIINVYFYYKDLKKIKSQWILQHVIPESYIFETSYFHVIPAYISVMNYALRNDPFNQWCCLLTDSCCPITSPERFRRLFYENYNKSIMGWRRAWWNISFHKRANLALLPSEYHLGNEPWFTLKREHVLLTIRYMNENKELVKTICSGGLANESLFAIILKSCKQLDNNSIINYSTHITDWNRMSSFTSPHVFKEGNALDLKFIGDNLERNNYALFIRKIASEFPDAILQKYIYENEDNDLVIIKPFAMTCQDCLIFVNKYKLCFVVIPCLAFLIILYKN